jgi:hypothetical protein
MTLIAPILMTQSFSIFFFGGNISAEYYSNQTEIVETTDKFALGPEFSVASTAAMLHFAQRHHSLPAHCLLFVRLYTNT